MTLALLATFAVLLPGLGALLGGVVGYALPKGNLSDRLTMALTTGGVALAAAASWSVFLSLWNGAPGVTADWFTWISSDTWQLSMGLLVDRLSATMLIVVTTVSLCVHVYSIGYMADDASRRRFFIYLSVFTLAMLLLVTAPNLVQMFLGWEGVGVCSYLLIGFWHQKESANAAAMKAFIVNRVADAALLLGLFTLLVTFGSLTYADILPRVAEFADAKTLFLGHEVSLLGLAAGLIFIGAMGKSAQFGLHTWLPDAMEGPTPVSALIHAATMVTAGVFLLCRLSPLYELTPFVLQCVALVGALTAIFAATVGLTQTDIKRVIAYSTCSQLGYMFFAIGVSAYPAAMFHLTTHAFFKALLFLGAGSVIHGMHHEQNLFRMGALKTALPVTYGLIWLGSLALAGIPPFAGFFSKDLILEAAFAQGTMGQYIYLVGTLAAFLTAIYSFRLLFLAFHGPAPHADHHHDEHHAKPAAKATKTKAKPKAHGHDDHHHTPHESPWSMLLPMLPLAVGAVAAGYLLLPMTHLEWWQGSIAIAEGHHALEAAHHSPLLVKLAPLFVAVSGILLAWWLYVRRRGAATKVANEFDLPYAISLNKWYIDELYDFAIVKPTRAVANLLYKFGDQKGIDGLINGTAAGVKDLATTLRPLQSGYIYHYAFAMLVALTLALAWLFWKAT